MNHVISWSGGGKDSTATVILMHEHYDEIVKDGDKVTVLFAEVMFDKKNNISGHNPDIIEFVYDTKKRFEEWNFNVEILHAEKDFLDIFYHKLTRSPNPERVGLVHGFVPAGICAVKRDCKMKPIKDWNKAHRNEQLLNYVGIATDEKSRLESLHKDPSKVSLLEQFNLTEADAKSLCQSYDLLSPQYSMDNGKQSRDGCWFCQYAKLCEHAAIKKKCPKAWKTYISLENIPNLANPKWNPYTTETLHDRDYMLEHGFRQMRLDEFM